MTETKPNVTTESYQRLIVAVQGVLRADVNEDIPSIVAAIADLRYAFKPFRALGKGQGPTISEHLLEPKK